MIELRNVKKRYKKRVLFANVNMKIINPGIYCFIGENGSGKTTLLNLIAGFIKPTSGMIKRNFKKCSFISQNVNLLSNLTIKEHFKMFNLDINLLRRINLYSKINKYPHELSFGMRQRVAVLIGLYNSASVVVCDEPTSHLDKYNSSLIMKEIKIISRSKVVLLVSHNEKIVAKYSDVIYQINNKKIEAVKENRNNKKVVGEKGNKNNFTSYFRSSFKKNKRLNLYYFVIFFFLLFMLNLTINLKDNFSTYIYDGKNNALDYNKFYLKECEKKVIGKVTVKECFNLKQEKVDLLEDSEHKLSLNYDILLNDLYGTHNLSVINPRDSSLKAGRYPIVYNEIIASDNYFVGQEIRLDSSKVISWNKTDIYKKELVLKVVGIANEMPFIDEDKIYLDYSLIEDYLKGEYLINNKGTLFEYFNDIDMDNYKYVVYFKTIDIELLNNNDIEYLSASYEYYCGLEEAFKQISNCLIYLNIFMEIIAAFYVYKLVRKKVENKASDILFFKASGVGKRKIIRLINKENILLILNGGLLGLVLNFFVIKIIFKEGQLNILFFIFSILASYFLNKEMFKREVLRKVTI